MLWCDESSSSSSDSSRSSSSSSTSLSSSRSSSSSSSNSSSTFSSSSSSFLLYGLLAVTNFSFDFSKTVMGVLAIIIALLIFWENCYPYQRRIP